MSPVDAETAAGRWRGEAVMSPADTEAVADESLVVVEGAGNPEDTEAVTGGV